MSSDLSLSLAPNELDAAAHNGDRFKHRHIAWRFGVGSGHFLSHGVELQEHATVDDNRHQHGK